MRRLVSRILPTLLLAGVLGLPGCSSENAIVINMNGQWLMTIEFNNCNMPGIFKGGDSRMETIAVTQTGDTLWSSFQDNDGNAVQMWGYMSGGRFNGMWETQTPSNRTVRFNSFGNLSETGSGFALDGFFVVDSDSEFDCYNVQFGFCAIINPSAAPGGPAPAQGIVYAGRGYSEDVDVIDTNTMTVIDTIVGAGGYRMALSLDGNTLFGTTGDSTFTVSDTGTLTLTTEFDPGIGFPAVSTSELEPIVLSPDGSRVYVLDEQGTTALYVIDAATNAVISATVLALDEPENVVISPDGLFLYCTDNSDVVKIDIAALAIVGSAPVGSDAHGIAINPTGTRVYADGVGGGIDVIDTTTMMMVANIAGVADGYYLEMSRDGRRLYGVNESSTLAVMDTVTNALIQNVTLSEFGARGVTTNADGSLVFVATNGGMIRLDAGTLMETGLAVGVRGYQSLIFR